MPVAEESVAGQHTQEMIDQWHRWFAVECNNRAWDLIEKASRTAAEGREMLHAACASAFHWSKVGTPIHSARSDVTLSYAHALLGHPGMAMHYAKSALAFFESHECENWDLAFTHAAMAQAAALAGDKELHARHYALAGQWGDALQDGENRRMFMESFSRVPAVAGE